LFLPLYHIYGLNVVLNPMLMLGATLVLMPRFNVPAQLLRLLTTEADHHDATGSTGTERL
jgi:acyl-CoA synthetase (AMP-forming)/AMP-acid ligase II